ncbi:uncharacterized protein M421DRAFT_417661, partial [Didymella exigua CBS 183.55]
MQLPRRSVRSIQELPSIHTAFPVHYKPVRTHSASTASNSARSPSVEDGLEVVPLERDSILSAPIVSAYLNEKEVFINKQEILWKPLPNIPTSIWSRAWGRMSVKYRVLAVLGLQALVLLTTGIVLMSASSKPNNDDHAEVRRTGGNSTNTSIDAPLERGTFLVPIQLPQQQSSTCLARANESRAWQCAFDMDLQLSILPSLRDDDTPIMVTLGQPSTSNRSVHCSQQAPEIGPTALTTLASSDHGLQYYFSATYDRTVILRQEQLGQDKSTSSPMQDQNKHTTFLPGTSLWRCTFNDTLLEGFIYTEKDAGSVSSGTNATAQLPFKLKLMERMNATGGSPYCEKVTVGLDGELEDGGASVNLTLADGRSGFESVQGNLDNSCQCQWIV